jgi:vitamin B12 transporter
MPADRRAAAFAAVLAAALASPALAQDPVPPPAGEAAPPKKEEPERKEALLEQVEIVATGYEQEQGRSTNPISVIDGDWFEEHQVSDVADGLRQVPGVTVARGGTSGAATSLFLRGAGSNQVLVLQDGMPLNDPTIGGQFNFFDLDALDLDRVEVLRGSYGVLYGSSAIGGVVNLVSRRGEGPAAFRASAEVGSFMTHRETLTGGAGDKESDWSFGVAETGTDGPHDREGFRSLSLAGLFGAKVAGDGRAEFSMRALDSTAEDPYDFGSPLPKDPNIRREREIVALGASLEKPVASWLTAKVRATLTDIDSAFRNGGDTPTAPDEFKSTSEATTTLFGASLRAVGNLDAKGENTLEVIAGGDTRAEESFGLSESPFGSGVDVDETTRNSGAFLLASTYLGPFTLTGGGRYDRHSQAGGEWSPQAGAAYRCERSGTTVRGNYGQGFRAATPAEFTDPFVGNPDLGPERSESVDLGVDQEVGSWLSAEATWFRLRTRDLIAFDATSGILQNIDRTEVTGVEFGLRAEPGAGFTILASVTHQRPRDLATHASLPNRPDDFGSLGVEWKRGDWTVTADLYWQGAVDDLGATGPDQDLRDHAGRRKVMALGARWQATKRLKAFARVENLWNERYVETPFAPRGEPFALFAGLSLDF